MLYRRVHVLQASDIRMLMRRYEHWAHRLFPKYPLRTVTEVIETSLASKKDVRVSRLDVLCFGDTEEMFFMPIDFFATVMPWCETHSAAIHSTLVFEKWVL